MPSLIPGYEYDIFISYRQKDNKYDGWVTEFVVNLRKELEATFKEDVSIYFDENPHDGLLETHNVDKSLHGKLKCLIFIPILSQTYCDPASFAWHSELLTFRNLAMRDHFGLDITLRNGNVASRILPVRIHELDAEDKSLFEKETGGKLRSIDFIFRSAGVNRPLRSKDDDLKEITHYTFYRDQINRVANAIHNIIIALKAQHSIIDSVNEKNLGNRVFSADSIPARKNVKVAARALGLALLSFFIYWFVSSQILNSSDPDSSDVEKSIAVLPFKNLSDNSEDRYLADGMTDAILNHLQRIKDLSVRSRSSTDQYRESVRTAREIGKALNVSYILEGSFQKVGNKANLTVQLIQTKDDEHLWAQEYHRDWSDIFNVQKDVASLIAQELYASITKDEAKAIETIPTTSMIAYDYYLKANQAHWAYWEKLDERKIHESLELFRKAIELDKNFSLAYTGLGRAYWMLANVLPQTAPDSYYNAKRNFEKAISLDVYNGWAYAELGVVNSVWEWDSTAARKNFDLARKIIPNDWSAYIHDFFHSYSVRDCKRLKRIVQGMKRIHPLVKDSIAFVNILLLKCQGEERKIRRLADVYLKDNSTLMNARPLFTIYLQSKEYEKVEKIVRNYKENSKYRPLYYEFEGILKAKTGNITAANAMLDSLKVSDGHLTSIASVYAALGEKEQMYKYLGKALERRDPSLHQLRDYGSFDPYFEETRFKELLSKIWIPLTAN